MGTEASSEVEQSSVHRVWRSCAGKSNAVDVPNPRPLEGSGDEPHATMQRGKNVPCTVRYVARMSECQRWHPSNVSPTHVDA
jgi:hypothetical protein